jgi:hypothetical protein
MTQEVMGAEYISQDIVTDVTQALEPFHLFVVVILVIATIAIYKIATKYFEFKVSIKELEKRNKNGH